MNELTKYLALCARAGSKLNAFLLEHGQAFRSDANTFKGRRGRQGCCFMNATRKVLADSTLTYCEGFMLVYGVPLEHGWCVTRDGRVVDPTIHGQVTEYFGVAFNRQYLCEAMALNRVYGILGWSSKTVRLLVDGKVSDFKEQIGEEAFK